MGLDRAALHISDEATKGLATGVAKTLRDARKLAPQGAVKWAHPKAQRVRHTAQGPEHHPLPEEARSLRRAVTKGRRTHRSTGDDQLGTLSP